MQKVKRYFRIFVFVVIGFFVCSCGMQSIPKAKNEVEATVAEVVNQYKRRADLVPNLVKVVQGYASHEKETLEGVVLARAKATSVNINANSLTADTLQKFQSAQGELSSALGKLMVVAERYPELKANENFRDLQAQLEGTENRITVARNRHIEAIKNYNNLITVPPSSWTNSLMYNYEKMPQWTVSDSEKQNIEKPPAIEFK